MITVFALFEEPALNRALEALAYQRILVLKIQTGLRQMKPEMEACTARAGKNPPGEAYPARVLHASTLLAELEALGLSPSESLFFADSMRQGAQTLVLRSLGSDDPSNLLRRIGAIHVVTVRE